MSIVLAAVVTLVAGSARGDGAPIFWGSYVKGDTYGYDDPPFDLRSLDAFESHAGKRVSILHWGQPWYWTGRGGYMAFRKDLAEKVRQRGSIPMVNWNSWDLASGSLDQPDFRLSAIISGRHDAYIRQWARDAKAWGHPLFVRFDHEMNGSWFPWSERVNGNSSGEFARMWRHVVDIFKQQGANNVTWVWAPNRVWPQAIPLASLYPGSAYVDWTGWSGYNWGTNPAKPGNVWQSFSEVHRGTYDALASLAPDKPMMIAETATTEFGGSKASWITDGLVNQLPRNWPRVKAVVWFNWNAQASAGPMDWVIESSSQSQAAFRQAIGSSYYASNTFANLPLRTKIVPIGETPPAAGGGSAGGAAAAGAGSSPGAGGASGTALRGAILSFAALVRCRLGQALCLRLEWRAGVTGRVRYWIHVKQISSGAALVRRVGSIRTRGRHVALLTTARRPACGRVVVRLTLRAGGATQVMRRKTSVRRSCVPPPVAP